MCLTFALIGRGIVAGEPPPPPVYVADESLAGSETHQEPPRRRDPFRPFTIDLAPGDRRALTPLQRYELHELRVTGVVLGLEQPRAALEDSTGKGFIVTPGTPVGPNQGVITAILPRQVVIEERSLDLSGREHWRQVVLQMEPIEQSRDPNRE